MSDLILLLKIYFERKLCTWRNVHHGISSSAPVRVVPGSIPILTPKGWAMKFTLKVTQHKSTDTNLQHNPKVKYIYIKLRSAKKLKWKGCYTED